MVDSRESCKSREVGFKKYQLPIEAAVGTLSIVPGVLGWLHSSLL